MILRSIFIVEQVWVTKPSLNNKKYTLDSLINPIFYYEPLTGVSEQRVTKIFFNTHPWAN